MKYTNKFTYTLIIALMLTTFSCNNDDEETVINAINVENLDVTIDENPTNGQTIGTVQTDGNGTLSFSITSQTPTGALSINSSTGELTVANVALFDFETNPTISAIIAVVGADNTAAVTINLTNLNEIGVQELTAAIDENPTNGQSVGMVQVDGNGPFSFSIDAQSPAGSLDINTSTGELTVADAALFDFEVNPIVTGTVAVVGAESTAVFTINLNNLVEISADELTVAIDENPTDGQTVGSIQVNGGGNLNFNITSQTPANALTINASTGELSVVDPTLFDFETNPVITATIAIDDIADTTTAIATINLNDVDEITVQSLNTSIDENPTSGTVIGTLPASAGGSLTYSITFQNPAGAFNIDQNTGEISVADETLFDFEATPNMLATISVHNGVYSVSANAFVGVNDVNEIGEFKYGGVIFWLDGNGSGLVCDIVNQLNPTSPISGVSWSIGTNTITGASGTAIGTGQANTTAIINNHGTGVYAAALCDNLTTGGYSDWYLPSLFELSEIYTNKAIVDITAQANGGDVINFYHWSSTEATTDQANILLSNGGVASQGKNNSGALVRAVRTFTDF